MTVTVASGSFASAGLGVTDAEVVDVEVDDNVVSYSGAATALTVIVASTVSVTVARVMV
jgi:hypothetical protein